MSTLRFSPELIQKYANQFNEIYLIICSTTIISLIQITKLKYHFKIQYPILRSFKYSPVSSKNVLMNILEFN